MWWHIGNKDKIKAILDIALAAKEKIEDEKKRLQALKIIAQIQAIAGKGEEALRTLEAMREARYWRAIDTWALWLMSYDR